MFLNLFRHYVQKYQMLLLVVMCGVVFFTTAYLYVQFSSPSGDEPHFLIISQTLLKYHSLNVMLDYNHADYRLFYPIYIAPHVARNANGQLLPLHSIGGPILWLIPYYFLGRLGAVFFISLVSVFIILNIYKFLLTMNISKRYAFIVSLAYAVASPLYIYAHLTFIEPMGALICIYVLRKIFQQHLKIADLVLSSTLLGLLPWIHIRFALFEAVLFFALLYKIYEQNKGKNTPGLFESRQALSCPCSDCSSPGLCGRMAARRAAILPQRPGDERVERKKKNLRIALQNTQYYIYYLLPITVLFILFEIYNYKVWGTLNPAVNEVNDIHGGSKPFVVAPFNGILGVFFDQEYGLIVNFPVFIFLFVGVVLTMQRHFLRYNLLMLIVSIPYILLFTSFKDWSGGWCPPARFILVLLPLYSFYLAYALERINNLVSSLVLGIATLYGFIYNVVSALPSLREFNSGSGRNRALEGMQVFSHRLTDFLPSLFLPHQTPLFVAWIGLCVVLSLILMGSRTGRCSKLKNNNARHV